MSATGLTLFISYAHEDEPFRKDFEKHLSALRHEGLVKEWHDRMITAGQDWERLIHASLDRSHIIVFLVSPDFMASRYCSEVEVKRAMQRHEMGTARVIPVLIRPTDWQGASFSKLQAVPTDALPISEWKGRDAAFVDVVRHLREVCLDLAAIPGNPANPYVVAAVGDWYQAEVVVDIHPTGETKLASMRLMLVDKDDRQAVVRAEIESADLGDDEKTVEIPLDRPLEDSYGPLVGAVSDQIPANATVESRRIDGGADKLFIGGKTYYTTWVALEVEVRAGRDRIVQKGKTWMSSEIPLDGVVKMVMEIPGIITQTMVVTDYGRGEQRTKAKKSRRPTERRRQPVTLESVIVGSWNVNITQPLGQPVSATFIFDAHGLFSAEMMSPIFGMITMRGQWRMHGQTLIMQGVQTATLMNVPYGVQITFNTVSSRKLEGISQIGEHLTFVKS
jgi:hypothetical protein